MPTLTDPESEVELITPVRTSVPFDEEDETELIPVDGSDAAVLEGVPVIIVRSPSNPGRDPFLIPPFFRGPFLGGGGHDDSEVVGVHGGPLPGFGDPIFDGFFGRRQPEREEEQEDEEVEVPFSRCGLLCSILKGRNGSLQS